ncbi:hypothetical protein ABEB22_00330 [Thioclava sp. 'Guangxiensis']|uniref:hypothetical protein n=1 Tax=Thioclava sp. 'Guangxiensis' TaxID=3149044 RepID=UPI003877DA34
MAMGQMGAIQAKLGLDLSQFQSGARAASAEAQKMAGNINQAWAGVRNSVEVKAARSFDQLRASIDPAFAASQRYADIQRQVAGFVDSGVASQRAANQVLEQAAARYLGVATASDRAAQAARAGEAAQAEAARTAQSAARSYESLRASVDPLFASSQRYKQAVEVLNAAQAAGVVDDRARANTLRLLGEQLSATSGVMQRTGGISGRMSSAFSNASFQVQDFFVQIAGGTDVMRAFAMQAPQLLGALGFSGKLAMIGSALGTLVAVGAVVLPMLGDLGRKAKDMGEAVGDLESSLGDLRAALDVAAIPMAALRKEFGLNAEAAREMNLAMLDLAQLKAMNDLDASTEALRTRFADLVAQVDRFDAATRQAGGALRDDFLTMAQTSIRQLQSQFGLTIIQARGVADAMSKINSGDVDQVAAGAKDLTQVLMAVKDSAGRIPPDLQEAAEATIKTGLAAMRLAGYTEQAEKIAANLPVGLNSAADAAQRLASAMAAATGFSANLDNQIAMLDVQIEATRNKQNVANATRIAGLELEAQARRDAAVAAGEDALAADARLAIDQAQIKTMSDKLATLDQLTAAQKASTKAGTAGVKAAQNLAKAQAKEAERWRDLIDPMNRYRRELGELTALAKEGLLTPEEVQKAMAQLNADLADSLPLVGDLTDTLVDGLFTGFRTTLGSIGDMFKSWLKQMIATAAKNRILVAMGVTGATGVAGTAAAASGSAAGVMPGGSLGSIATSGLGLAGVIGTSVNAFISGAGGLVTSLTGAGGGLAAAGTYLTSVLGGATSGIAGLSAAIGAIALPVAAVGFLISGLIGKTKVLDTGIRALIGGSDVTVQTYERIEKSKFWGLSKSKRTTYSAASSEIADPIRQAVYGVQDSIAVAASALNIGAEAFDGFAYELKFSTKGLSEDEALEVLQDKLTELGDAYAGQVTGLEAFSASGEGAMETINRLASALQTVNAAMDTLGNSFRATGLVGADMASQLTQLFGGDEAFGTAVSTYYEAVYSESERLATLTCQTTEALAEMGLAMPESRDQYRALVDAMDLTSAGGRELWATLVGMAGVFDEILPQVSAFTAQIEALSGQVSTSLDGAITAYTAAQQASAQAATNWYKAADSIAEFVAEMRGTASAMTSPQSALAFSAARYQSTLASAKAGDLDATSGLTGVAQTYLDRVSATATSALDVARAQARVASDLGQVEGIAQIEGAKSEAIASLTQAQVDLMTEARDYLAAGNALTEEQITTLETQLGSLDDAIQAAAEINYASLQKQIDLAIDVVEDAKIPDYLKAMLRDSASGVTRYVDFITRSDLSADQKWLALTGASEHVKTISLIADQGQISGDLLDLALTSADTLVKTISYMSGTLLPADLQALALEDASSLLKSIRWVAQSLPADLRAIVFNDIDALDKVINFRVGQSVPGTVQKLALGEAEEFRRILDLVSGKLVSSRVQALALDDPTGFRRSLSIVAGVLPSGRVQTLALDAAKAFTRVLDFQLGRTPQAKIWSLALATTSKLQKTVNLLTGRTLDAETMRVALAGNSELARVVNVALSSKADARAVTLALGNLGAYAVTVNAALGKGITGDLRQLVFAGQGSYAAMIEAAFSKGLTADQRRILLTQQGGYIARITGVLAGNQSAQIKALLLNANTSAARAITIRAAFAKGLSSDQRAALSSAALTVSRIIAGTVRLGSLSGDQIRMLRAASGTLTRTLKGTVDLSGLTAQQQSLLAAVSGSTAGKITLGGSFRFDPSSAFASLMTSSVKAPMEAARASMVGLRASLTSLRSAVIAQSDLLKAQQKQAQVAAAQASYDSLMDQLANFTPDQAVGAPSKLSTWSSGGLAALATYQVGNKTFSAQDTQKQLVMLDRKEDRATYNAIVAQLNTTAYEQAMAYATRLNDAAAASDLKEQALETSLQEAARALRDLGVDIEIPQFAAGGHHAGGLRLVGEKGPEIEATGASRIWSADQTRRMLSGGGGGQGGGGQGSDTALVAEVKALREELAGMRSEQRQLGLSGTNDMRKLRMIEERREAETQ